MKKTNILTIKNKVIVIFGGCGLLGTEFSKYLANQEAKICVADVSQKKIQY